jgi:hypothetical protein
MPKLYHREVFMPERLLKLPLARIPVYASRHAERAALDDRYGPINLPSSLAFSGDNVIEAEMDGPRVLKLVVRLRWDDRDDAVFAIAPDGLIKTVWRNRRTDTHSTLKVHLYAKA